jgi:prevent-host-death family protein
MKWISSTYARDNWARVMDEAVHEPVAVTSHGRARVIIVDAALSEKLTGQVADTGHRLPERPDYPWFDLSLSMPQRIDKLLERKAEIHKKLITEWTDEEMEILRQDPWFLDE